MKIVLNKSHGGFTLSDGATRHLAALKSIPLFERDCEFWTEFYLDAAHEVPFMACDLSRTDPDLIAVVEEFGPLANGRSSSLEVREMHSGQLYRIRNYDGKEWLEFPTDIEWLTAT